MSYLQCVILEKVGPLLRIYKVNNTLYEIIYNLIKLNKMFHLGSYELSRMLTAGESWPSPPDN